MKTEKAIEIVEAYQLWRRDNSVPSIYKQPDPTELGKAIDKLIEKAKSITSIICPHGRCTLNPKENESRTN